LSTTDARPTDAHERSRAVDVGRSVIVQAPAGSGKTTLLVERFVNLLAVVDRPEEILAITFTRKAAAEMQTRVLAALADGSTRSQTIRGRGIQLGWQLDAQPSRLRIQTIDAFCVSLAHQLPIASGLSDGLTIVEDAHPLYIEAVHRLFQRLGAADPFTSELVALLELFDNDYDAAHTSLASMLARRDQWLEVVSSTLRAGQSGEASRAHERRSEAIGRAIEAGIASLHRSAIGDVEADLRIDQRIELGEIAADAANRLGRPWPQTDLPDELASWQFIADLVATQDGKPRSRLGTAQGFRGTNPANQLTKARLRALIDDLAGRDLIERISSLRSLPDQKVEAGEVSGVIAVATTLALAAVELDAIFRKRRAVDFAELSFAAHRALGQSDAPTDLALALDYRIKHLLVDEFQDTSATQYRLLSRLIQGWQPNDGRSLFIVGDPMQSIYRFRDADVSLFQRARRNGVAQIHPETIALTNNFRSSAAIVEWCNRVFGGAFGPFEDPVLGRVAFSAAAPARKSRDGDGCHVVIVAATDSDADESDVLVERIERIRTQRPNESIAILARNRAHLTNVIARLTARNIAWSGTDIQSLAERPVINDLMSLTRALCSAGDRIAWLSLLRAPFVGFSLADLEVVAQSQGVPAEFLRDARNDARLSKNGRERAERIRPVLIRAERSRRQMPVRAWIENAFIRLGGADAYDDPDAVRHAERFFGVIDEGHNRVVEIDGLERSIARLFAESSERSNPVTVMTIHRAKGLEFDHVLVPGLHRVGRIDDPQTILWRPEGDQLLLGVLGTSERGVHRWLRHEERCREANEQIRLLYVAATRARFELHLFAALAPDGDGLRAPPARSLLASIWPLVADRVEVVRQQPSPLRTTAPPQRRRVLPADYRWQPPKAR
jgi:ATP-dependent helicase/nuclease subunit A